MIKILSAMLNIAIKDLKVHLSNSNLSTGKKAICFKLLTQKRETGKQTVDVLYYKY